MAVPVGTAPAPHTIPVGMVRVHPPAATPNVRDPFRVAGEGPGATTHPRSPASNHNIGGSGILTRGVICVYGLRFSLSSDFLFLPPFLCLPGELRALALLGAPLLPLPSGAPLLPRHPGATGGRQFPPSLFGRGMMGCSAHHPPRGSSRRTKGGPGPLPPSSGRPRRGGAAPAFVGGPTASLSAPRAFALGTGTPQPPTLAARSPMRPAV
jgi:hypothetical protein